MRPHPFIIEGDHVALNCPEIAKAAISRAKLCNTIRGTLIMSERELEATITGAIEDAETVRGGRRFERGQGVKPDGMPADMADARISLEIAASLLVEAIERDLIPVPLEYLNSAYIQNVRDALKARRQPAGPQIMPAAE